MSGRPVILVAEDDPNDALFLERAFAEAGVNIPTRFANNGKQLLDYLEGKLPFDDRVANPLPSLLILDLKMPVIDGFEVLEWRQHQPRLRQIPVVAFSGLEGENNMRRAYALGTNLYLAKPASPRTWARLLTSLVEKYVVGALGPQLQQEFTPSPPDRTENGKRAT